MTVGKHDNDSCRELKTALWFTMTVLYQGADPVGRIVPDVQPVIFDTCSRRSAGNRNMPEF